MIEVQIIRKVVLVDHAGDTLAVETLPSDGPDGCLYEPPAGGDPCAVVVTAQGVHLTLDELRRFGQHLVDWANEAQSA